MFPWRSAWSTSDKARLPERRTELVRAHGLGAGGEAAEQLPQLEPPQHLGEGGVRIGRHEQVGPDRVLAQVADEARAVRYSRVARAGAPDGVRLLWHPL